MNPPNHRLTDTELTAYGSLAGAASRPTYSIDNRSVELARMCSRSAAISRGLPPLAIAICMVVGVASYEEVALVLAWWVIACVAYKLRFIPFRVSQFVRHAVSAHLANTEAKGAVAGIKTGGFPGPALIGAADINLRPEAGLVVWANMKRHCGFLFRDVALPAVYGCAGAFPILA